jgi:hypothetical protein
VGDLQVRTQIVHQVYVVMFKYNLSFWNKFIIHIIWVKYSQTQLVVFVFRCSVGKSRLETSFIHSRLSVLDM